MVWILELFQVFTKKFVRLIILFALQLFIVMEFAMTVDALNFRQVLEEIMFVKVFMFNFVLLTCVNLRLGLKSIIFVLLEIIRSCFIKVGGFLEFTVLYSQVEFQAILIRSIDFMIQ
jgi:hypothetical protein